MPMLELALTVLAFALLVAGVVGSLAPQVPGAPFSIAGVLVYWIGSGFSDPGLLVLVALIAVGLFTLVVDWVAGAVAAKVGGASTATAVLSGLVGLVLFFATGLGPVGLLLGVSLTVFALEYYRQRDAQASAKAAAVTTAGMLGSAVVQTLLTGSMLLAMVVVALL